MSHRSCFTVSPCNFFIAGEKVECSLQTSPETLSTLHRNWQMHTVWWLDQLTSEGGWKEGKLGVAFQAAARGRYWLKGQHCYVPAARLPAGVSLPESRHSVYCATTCVSFHVFTANVQKNLKRFIDYRQSGQGHICWCLDQNIYHIRGFRGTESRSLIPSGRKR